MPFCPQLFIKLFLTQFILTYGSLHYFLPIVAIDITMFLLMHTLSIHAFISWSLNLMLGMPLNCFCLLLKHNLYWFICERPTRRNIGSPLIGCGITYCLCHLLGRPLVRMSVHYLVMASIFHKWKYGGDVSLFAKVCERDSKEGSHVLPRNKESNNPFSTLLRVDTTSLEVKTQALGIPINT